jgi:stearoyl-CoA desaturase (delta-9 desaturase)
MNSKLHQNGNGVEHSTDKKRFKPRLVWFNIIAFIYLHSAALYSIYLVATVRPWATLLFCFVTGVICTAYGIAAGAHRLLFFL